MAHEIDGTRSTLNFSLSDGSDWSLPTIKSMRVQDVIQLRRRLANGDDQFDVFVDLIDTLAPGLSDVIVMSELEEISALWYATADLGKS